MTTYINKILTLYLFFFQLALTANEQKSSEKEKNPQAISKDEKKAEKVESEKADKPKVDLFDPPEFRQSDATKKHRNKQISKPLLKSADLPQISLKAKVIKSDNSSLAVLLIDNKEVMVEPKDVIPLVVNKMKWELSIKSITKNGVEVEINYNSLKFMVK